MMAFSRRTRVVMRRVATVFALASCASVVAQPETSAPRCKRATWSLVTFSLLRQSTARAGNVARGAAPR